MKHLLSSLLCLFLVQCVSTTVSPVAGGLKAHKVYIVRNNDDFMDEFLPKMEGQIRQLGYATEIVGQAPAGNACYLTYQANWTWDFAMYLAYFKATLHEGQRTLGSAEYDARLAGLDFNKFGHTETKIRPVLKQLFGK